MKRILSIAMILATSIAVHGQTLIKLKQLEQTPAGTGSLIITVGTPGIPTYTPTIPYSKITGTSAIGADYVPYSSATKSVNLNTQIFTTSGTASLGPVYITAPTNSTGLFIKVDATGSQFPIIVSATTGCNADYIAEGPTNSRFIWKNTTSGVRWFAGNDVLTDNFGIGQSGSVASNFLNINNSTGNVYARTGLGVGSLSAPTITFNSTGSYSASSSGTVNTQFVTKTASVGGDGIVIRDVISATTFGGIYGGVTPGASNYALAFNSTQTLLNAPSGTTVKIQEGGNTIGTFDRNKTIFSNANIATGALTSYSWTAVAQTNQTAATEIPGVKYTLEGRTWQSGATIATQREFYISSPTYAFTGASTITKAYSLYVARATVGTNATITNNFGIGTDGSIEALGLRALGFTQTLLMDQSGTGLFETQFVVNGGVSIASTGLSSPVGMKVNGTAGTEVFRASGLTTSGATNQFIFSGQSCTGQTASTEISGLLYNSHTRTWATGAITTQRERYFKTITYAFASASTITDAYGLYVEKATLGSNATITNNYALGLEGSLKINDTYDIVVGTGTGTKFGTATSQKIGFWNATPVVQPTTADAAATLVSNGGTTLTDTDTFDGYTIKQVVKALRTIGILQ